MEKKYIKFSLAVTYAFIAILFLFTITLPFLVTWYAETMNRSQTLATTVMVTCYPCVPFAATLLLLLRKLLKNALKDNFFCKNSIEYLKNISICSVIISVITFIGGKFYLPFLIVGTTFAFLSLLIFSLKSILAVEIEKVAAPNNDKD